MCRRHLCSVGPFGAAQAEDVAQSIIRNDPAFGKRRFNLSLCIELDEPLHQRAGHHSGGGLQNLPIGVCRAGIAADHAHGDVGILSLPTAGKSCQQEQGRGQLFQHIALIACLGGKVTPWRRSGADGGTRTRTSRGKQILSLLRLPVSPRPHAARIGESRPCVKGKAEGTRLADVQSGPHFLARLKIGDLLGGNIDKIAGSGVAPLTPIAAAR